MSVLGLISFVGGGQFDSVNNFGENVDKKGL
jgi:hypothetical protein